MEQILLLLQLIRVLCSGGYHIMRDGRSELTMLHLVTPRTRGISIEGVPEVTFAFQGTFQMRKRHFVPDKALQGNVGEHILGCDIGDNKM